MEYLPIEETTALETWLGWAREVTDHLQRAAVQNLSHRRIKPRRPPAPVAAPHDPRHSHEAGIYHEVDVWRRRAISRRR
jgi:hypothetical protein